MSKCGFYMEQKRRHCGMSTRAGAGFCLEHAAGSTDRVPCPLDRGHTVARNKLKRHLSKCNKLEQKHRNDDEPFYRPGVNAAAAAAAAGPKDRDPDPEASLIESIAIVERIYAAEFADLPVHQRQNEFMEQTRCQEVVATRKHAVQQSSLIQHLADRGLLLDSSFVEFGCGRAELSRYINQCVAAAGARAKPRYVLIDRASNRMKFDSKLREDWEQLGRDPPGDHVFPRRCRIDIRDVWLNALAEPGQSYVAVSKHLCGVATDLALRALANAPELQLRGICVAMCCRHVCDAAQYVNPGFVEQLLRAHAPGALAYSAFFDALRKMCSWATCGRAPGAADGAEPAHVTGLPQARREQLGHMARRIIDEGRLAWAREHLGLEAELVKYVAADVSLENFALMGRKACEGGTSQ